MTDNGSPGICGATNDLGLNSTGPECSGEKTWDEAVDICMDHGAMVQGFAQLTNSVWTMKLKEQGVLTTLNGAGP